MRVRPSTQLSARRPSATGSPLGARIADDADLGPKLGLRQRQIVDVAEQTSDRRAQAMQNA